MAVTAKMVAAEVLMCGLKFGLRQVPVVGAVAVSVVEGLQKRHETLSNAARLAEFEAQLSRVERGMRDTVEREMRAILANLGRPDLPGPELTREMNELRQIHEQGWSPNLFEGLLRNSTHWQELRRRPRQYGRVLGDHDPVDPENGIPLLIDTEKDGPRILELSPSSLAYLLAHQPVGIPVAEVLAAQDIWAFPSSASVDAAPRRVSAPPPPPIVERKTQVVVPGPPAPARLTNSVGMPLVRIEPGTFMMGGNEAEDEKPPHEVRITRAFYLGAHPVTRGQYRAVTGADPSHFKGVDELPVESVSWFDAVQFCNKLSEMEKRTPCYRIEGQNVTVVNGNGFRLPTEAEWEYACRAGSTTRFPFGDQESDLGQHAWFSGNSGSKTRAVGSKKPNRWGLYDMLGNVWEWCQDGYDEDYYPRSPRDDTDRVPICAAYPDDEDYYPRSPRDDPPGASGAPSRVRRGGSWYDAPVDCRPADRCANAPGVRYRFFGFRLAAVQ